MFELSIELEELANSVIEKYDEFGHLKNGCHIAYLYSEEKKTKNGKLVYADTTKLNEKMKYLVSYDFIITFYRHACEPLDDEKMEVLMRHELKHVGFDDGRCFIIPHDVEDFKEIIDAYGTSWII